MPHDSDAELPKPDPSLGIDTLVVQAAIHDLLGSAKPFVQPGDNCHALARSMFRSGFFGAMIAFEVKNLDRTGAFALVDSLRLAKPVTSLGDIYSLILHPASTSHRWLTVLGRIQAL